MYYCIKIICGLIVANAYCGPGHEISTSPTGKPMNIPLQSSISEQDLSRVNQPIGEASGMPNAAYREPQWFDFERDHVLGNYWTAITFVDTLSKNSVRPVDFMGAPVLLSKNKDGEIRVFHNVCSHRGTKLVAQEKTVKGLIVCPYHAWSYNTEGALKRTPNIGGVGVDEVAGFSCANHGLKEIPSYIWLGILFINLNANAAPFAEAAEPVIQRYRELMGDSAETLLRADTKVGHTTIDVACNWKLAIENYLEAYHLPTIHPGLNSYSPLEKHYTEIFSALSSGQITKTFDPGLDRGNPLPVFPEWHSARIKTGEYPVVYPNLLLGFQANHLFAIIIQPQSSDRCTEELMLFYVGDEAMGENLAVSRQANMDAWISVFNEDIGPCERMQIGRHSPGYDGGVFSPVLDTCSHHFHQWIAQQYQIAL